MNKTKKSGTFALLEIIFPVKRHKSSLLSSQWWLETNIILPKTIHFLNMYLAFLIVIDFLAFPSTSRYISTSWNNIKSPLLLHRQTWLNALCARASYSFQNDEIMIINDLLGKPTWQTTGEELLFHAWHCYQPNNSTSGAIFLKEQKHHASSGPYLFRMKASIRPVVWYIHKQLQICCCKTITFHKTLLSRTILDQHYKNCNFA